MPLSDSPAKSIAYSASVIIIGVLTVVGIRSRRIRSQAGSYQHTADLFLGFDFSTQSLTTVIINPHKRVEYFHQLSYEADLPEFKTEKGLIFLSANEVVAPSLMFISALEKALSVIPSHLIKRIRVVSGSAQQHGSMFWSNQGNPLSATYGDIMDASKSLTELFSGAFAITNGPIWMDSSTSSICRELEGRIAGGAGRVAEITGSRAYERFTGNQIAKILRLHARTKSIERVSLLSSGIASVLCGKYVPIDISDGSGMNLMDLQTCAWSEDMLDAYAKISRVRKAHWIRLLGAELCASSTSLGSINPYFCERFGFNSGTRIVSFSGDNPCTVAGLEMELGDIAVSLGTSTTLFALTNSAKPSGTEGHVLRNPIDAESYMVMICFKNGALPRLQVCRSLANGSWDEFNRLLENGLQQNADAIVFAFPEAEITPTLRTGIGFATFLGDAAIKFEDLTPSVAIASLIRGQCLALRRHWEVLEGARPQRLIATGGASVNKAILQVLADVFQCPIYVPNAAVSNTAALGAAYRAYHGWLLDQHPGLMMTFRQALGKPELIHVANPRKESKKQYERLMPIYIHLEEQLKVEYGSH